MRFNEMIQQLPQQFAARVSRHHARPDTLTLNEEETYSLANCFPSSVILEAFTRAGTYTKQHRHAERTAILKVLQNIASRLLNESHARGKHTNFSGMSSQTQGVRPATCSAPTEQDIYDVQRDFQESVATHTLDSQWTLHEFEAVALLAGHSVPDLRRLFDRVGKWVLQQRTQQLIFHDQDSVIAETFKIAHTSQPTAHSRGATMTSEQATAACNQMLKDSGITDPQLGAAQVIRDLIKIANNTSSPLAAVEAAEILLALDPEGWAQGLNLPLNEVAEDIREYRAQQQDRGKENA